ncbi:hypothetical protein ACFSR7_36155 [Cohnella sp. GCM10020058]|uniref:hypothetical protein n=1 Tax=Cohnella sp. GCM10020058 TaxID=3317330 RepID=UPI00362E223C
MRRVVVAFLVGVALTVSLQAGAAELLKGSKVAGTRDVTLGGKSIGQAAIINNTSYLPVRSVSDALGLQIDLSGGKINLTTSETPKPAASSSPTATPTPATTGQSVYSAERIGIEINSYKEQISYWQRIVDRDVELGLADDPEAQLHKSGLDSLKAELAIWEQRKADLEAQK